MGVMEEDCDSDKMAGCHPCQGNGNDEGWHQGGKKSGVISIAFAQGGRPIHREKITTEVM